jgi:hypothetical protein
VADTARCLDDLSAGQRRVLSLRAGLGAGPPRSRTGVARRLRISERRVVRLERTGLRRLRVLDRAGACAPPVQAGLAAETASSTTLAADPASSTTLAAATAPAGERGGRSGSTRSRAKAPAPERDTPRGGTDLPPAGAVAGVNATNAGDGFDLTLPLILLVVAALTVVGVARLRRQPAALALTRSLRDDEDAVAALKESRRPEPWVPWFRSPMKGPSWNDPRPPEDRPDDWRA